MPTCHIELRAPTACRIALTLADANRVRWTVAAVRSHAALRASLFSHSHAGVAHLVDNIVLMGQVETGTANDVLPGTHVVLWDGYNSLLELHSRHPAIAQRQDLVYLCVGMVPEVIDALPAGTLPLYATDPHSVIDMASSQHVRLPLAYDLGRRLRTRLRLLRNWHISRERHRQLSRGGRIVFCGLIRPSEHVLKGFLRGTQLDASWVHDSGLVNLSWQGRSALVKETVLSACAQLLDNLRHIAAPTPADWAGVYTLMNVMHRLGTLSLVSEATDALFVNEFAQNQHLDPYDAAGYERNLFVDFGSVRGPDALYPRTVDMALNHKPALTLRWLPDGDRVARCLAADTPEWLWRRCEEDAQRCVAALQTLR